MFETVKAIARATKRTPRAFDNAGDTQSYAYHGSQDGKVVMWLSGQKVTLRLEDWMRGH